MAGNRFKIFISVILFLLTIVLCTGGYLFFDVSSFVGKPFKSEASEKVFFILPGQSLQTIARNLDTEGLVSSRTYFSLYATVIKAGKNLQAGEYLVSAAQSPEQILDMFVKGRARVHKMTIPEGLTMREMSLLFEPSELCAPEKFLDLSHDPDLIAGLGIPATSLEGYLFPDTYFFTRQNTCKDIITIMVRRFHSVFTEEWQKRATELGFSYHDILILASIIEKETGDPSERPLISSVFHNRLKKNMRLESDPTAIYGLEEFDGNIRRIHLKTATPYNTYRIIGLPPGPIANPGAMSLHAALYPEASDYYFFVSKKDTTHHFSKTYDEHKKAIQKYLLGK